MMGDPRWDNATAPAPVGAAPRLWPYLALGLVVGAAGEAILLYAATLWGGNAVIVACLVLAAVNLTVAGEFLGAAKKAAPTTQGD